MKTEIRKVTIEQEVYIAEDGREFLDEDECLAYETGLAGRRIKMYNRALEETISVEGCYFAKLLTWSEVQTFRACCEYYGLNIDGLERPGIYFYDDGAGRFDHWINMNEVLDKIISNEEAKNDQT